MWEYKLPHGSLTGTLIIYKKLVLIYSLSIDIKLEVPNKHESKMVPESEYTIFNWTETDPTKRKKSDRF